MRAKIDAVQIPRGFWEQPTGLIVYDLMLELLAESERREKARELTDEMVKAVIWLDDTLKVLGIRVGQSTFSALVELAIEMGVVPSE